MARTSINLSSPNNTKNIPPTRKLVEGLKKMLGYGAMKYADFLKSDESCNGLFTAFENIYSAAAEIRMHSGGNSRDDVMNTFPDVPWIEFFSFGILIAKGFSYADFEEMHRCASEMFERKDEFEDILQAKF